MTPWVRGRQASLGVLCALSQTLALVLVAFLLACCLAAVHGAYNSLAHYSHQWLTPTITTAPTVKQPSSSCLCAHGFDLAQDSHYATDAQLYPHISDTVVRYCELSPTLQSLFDHFSEPLSPQPTNESIQSTQNELNQLLVQADKCRNDLAYLAQHSSLRRVKPKGGDPPDEESQRKKSNGSEKEREHGHENEHNEEMGGDVQPERDKPKHHGDKGAEESGDGQEEEYDAARHFVILARQTLRKGLLTALFGPLACFDDSLPSTTTLLAHYETRTRMLRSVWQRAHILLPFCSQIAFVLETELGNLSRECRDGLHLSACRDATSATVKRIHERVGQEVLEGPQRRRTVEMQLEPLCP